MCIYTYTYIYTHTYFNGAAKVRVWDVGFRAEDIQSRCHSHSYGLLMWITHVTCDVESHVYGLRM